MIETVRCGPALYAPGSASADRAVRIVRSRQVHPRVTAEDRDVDQDGVAAHPLAAGLGFVEHRQRGSGVAASEQRRRQRQQCVASVSPVSAT
jgi:hypothetical protein